MGRKKNRYFEGFGLYIHFPFCVRKCAYCDFASYKFQKTYSKKYFSYLRKEVEIFVSKFPESSLKRVQTIYVGGGTPSLMDVEEFSAFLSFLKRYFDFSNLKEFTIEANPESIEKEKFEDFLMLSANRVSIGMQSFNDETLRILGRVHDSKTAVKKFELLRSIGFNNINIDLIFALPNESFEAQMNSLKKAISLNPEHISYYALMLERGTPLNKMKNRFTFPNEDTWLKEFSIGKRLLEDNGYIHYEISNYAKRTFECIHNISYWRSFPYLGFGISAGGFYNGIRYVNVRDFESYFRRLDKCELPFSTKKKLSVQELKSEFIFMGLRLLDGVYFSDYYHRFGSFLIEDFKEKIEKLSHLKLLKVEKDKIALSERGVRFANVVFREFI
ncbi:radical SAM family heme chaperone HemW [Caldisericum exile]|uniref:Heme chaperone HemW n=1 Tax=Caldisericum exile (strain DSM 21853 / NBRC 104410 / AZM16c01) TaxID=511051 RepID=A0A7U6GE81_CALEA|nr:radical SAM family heme chaperone HemW [Caldisericum exile]BAL80768.1 oxygen-independent coproporphyrinogen III oxidase [Caldisericum exile AZM16c01]